MAPSLRTSINTGYRQRRGSHRSYWVANIHRFTFMLASPNVGTVATPGDLVFGAALNLLTRLAPECLDGFPKIKALNGLIQSNEGIQVCALLSSPFTLLLRASK
jgi:hypothetical protein